MAVRYALCAVRSNVWALALSLAALALAACNRGPVRMTRGSGTADDSDLTADVAAGPAPDASFVDPDATSRCSPFAQLAAIPRDVPGWTVERSPIFPYERLAGYFTGFVGRLYRGGKSCAVASAARLADAAKVFDRLAEERGARADRFQGRPTLTRASPEANQVTTWIADGADRIVLVRAFGSTDPDILRPFLEALFPASAPDAGTTERPDAVEECGLQNPLPDAYDPDAFYGPPGDCWL
jgi:hypothetical protein